MSTTEEIKTRVTAQTKQAVVAVAKQQDLSEAAWLRHLVESTLQNAGVALGATHRHGKVVRSERLMIRLRPDDRLLLPERAAARSMAPATYASALVRAHLRNLAPIPKEELTALKRSVAELGSIGRNLNQLARSANQGRVSGPGREDLRALLKVCEGLRDHVKTLLTANRVSWERGYAEESH